MRMRLRSGRSGMDGGKNDAIGMGKDKEEVPAGRRPSEGRRRRTRSASKEKRRADSKNDDDGGKYPGHAVRVYKRRSEVPEWLRFNPYVLDYYRSNLTVSECVASVFAIHNETGNIWSHLLPIFYLAYPWAQRGPWPDAPWTFAAATVPSMICLLCSNAYHTFMPLPSASTYRSLLLVDYLSVFNVMIWPTFNLINYSLVCHPEAAQYSVWAYILTAASMLAVALLAKNNVQRLVPFAVLSAGRMILNITRALVGNSSPWGSFYYMMVEVFGIGGGILNATRLPEKRAPGKYDLLGNSHQVMHVLTAMAQVCVLKAAEHDRAWWVDRSC